jgi:hypothetical protein
LYSLVLYTTERGDSPIDEFLDGLDKKSQQLKEKDIELSERRLEDWIRRFTSGGGT